MNLRQRLARLERLPLPLRNASERCTSCGAPDPCVPSVVALTEEGFYESEGATAPRPACSASGTVVAVDPRTGDPVRPIKVIELRIGHRRVA